MKYRLSSKAIEDIENIFEYGASEFGLNQALEYHDQLEKTFQFLSKNPTASKQRIEIKPPVRIHPIGSHIVVYSILEDKTVFIIRVRLEHEDWIND